MPTFHERLQDALKRREITPDVWAAAQMLDQLKNMIDLHDIAGFELAKVMSEHWARAGEPLNALHIEQDHSEVAAQAFTYWLLMESIRENMPKPNDPQ